MGASMQLSCTHKYASLVQIPWRVFCKKGCDADGDTWDECVGECDEICYKDPVLKDKQWSAYIDRSPGSVTYSEECFRACVSGCSYKFDIPEEKLKEVHARPTKPPPMPPAAESRPTPVSIRVGEMSFEHFCVSITGQHCCLILHWKYLNEASDIKSNIV
ncbi:uncharacterized protein LOC121784167 [Salvia splendens]|uniref:uncharacterized protein LOC121784167 n=1 Tax=Salvia splendens TaxID=180675 RepID=UPI001C26D0D3|nr:uncharacterized protein LOC121784167 [Salvia splendens]